MEFDCLGGSLGVRICGVVVDTWDPEEEKPLWLHLLAAHYQLS